MPAQVVCPCSPVAPCLRAGRGLKQTGSLAAMMLTLIDLLHLTWSPSRASGLLPRRRTGCLMPLVTHHPS